MRQRRISDQQIEEACRALLRERRHVGVRDVMAQLRLAHGAIGRTERVAAVLRRAMTECPVVASPAPSSDQLAYLRERLRVAEERAARAEAREIQHQDYWARRYAERLEELERSHAIQLGSATRTASERYLRLYQWAARLTNRLSQYEAVESPAMELQSGG